MDMTSYVWIAYSITALLLVALVLSTWLRARRITRQTNLRTPQ